MFKWLRFDERTKIEDIPMDSTLKKEMQGIRDLQLEQQQHKEAVIARARRIEKIRQEKHFEGKPLVYKLFHSIHGCAKCQ